MKHPPTEEQRAAIDIARSGKDMAIEAFAGAGKTSTLTMVADALPGIGQYVCFNKAIAMDAAGKFPEHVSARTAHSLAFAAVGHKYKHRLNARRMWNRDIAAVLGLDPLDVPTEGGGRKRLSVSRLAGIVMRGVNNFCITGDKQPTSRHFPYIDGIDPVILGQRTYANNELVRDYLYPYLQDAWRDAADIDGRLPFSHNSYLKLWELNNPRIEADFILHDESQDCNGAMLSIVQQQSDRAQLIWVGDRYQQIMGWNGAVNAMEKVDGERTWLTQSFRFGPEIAAIANLALADLEAEKLVHGAGPEGRVGFVDSPTAQLFRTNAGAVESALLYLSMGRKVHIVGGAGEIVGFAKASLELQATGNTEHNLLFAFQSWPEVQDYVRSDEATDENDLKKLVKLIDGHGAKHIMDALGACSDEQRADTILSTAHKSKGREWDSVRLGGDFPTEQLSSLPEEEIRLLYVAATRAKTALDVTLCPYFTKG